MACSTETSRVSLEDCTCPVCMCILIEPVTMPCHHELCRPCFKQNVEEASLLCPMCRTRIGTWARHASKTKTLVNQQRWEQIQELFPKRVRLRLEGKDEEDDSADVSFHRPVHLAAPGEIRREYEEELNRLRQQLNQERRREEQESEALIRRLQEEEDQERHRQQQQAMQTNENDEALARELDKVINEAGTDDPIDLLLEETKSRITRSNSAASAKSGQSSSGTLETFFSKYKAETDTRCVSEDPYPYACISPSDKDKGEDNSRSNSSIGKLSSSNVKTELYPFNLVDHSYCPHPNAPKSSTVVRPPSDEVMTISESSSDAGRERGDSAKERSESVASNDSISNELCHFKPILSCPRTPPRKMADGKVLDPPVVRTTPRNLSRNGFGSPVDAVMSPGLEPGSPIMQKRLNELALERQQLVRERSKSTSTGPDDELHRDDKKSHPLVRERTLSSDLSRPPLHKTDPVPPLVPTDLPDSVGPRSGLLIPLEPILEDHHYEDITPVLLNISNQATSLTVSKSPEEEQPSVSSSDIRAKTPTHDRLKRSRHVSKDLKGQKNLKAQVISPQRSIKDWFKTSDRESKTESPDLFEEKSDVISENQVVDSNANVKQVSGKRECNSEQGSGDAGGLVLPSESILETNSAITREKHMFTGEVETESGKTGNGKAQVKSGPKRSRRNKTPLQLSESDASPPKSDSSVSVSDPVALKPGRKKGKGLQEEQVVKESISDDDIQQGPEKTGRRWKKVSGNKEMKTNEELLVLKSNVRTVRTIKRHARLRTNVSESDCSESETEASVDNPVSVKQCRKKHSATVSRCSVSESESESEMTLARKHQHNMNTTHKVCDADPLRVKTNIGVPQRSRRRKAKEDADFDPESLVDISESETDPVTPAKKKVRRRRRVREDVNRPDVSDQDTKSQLLGRKRKGLEDNGSKHGDQDEAPGAFKPRRRGRKMKKSDEEYRISDDGMSSDDSLSVKGSRSRPTKTVHKKSPAKTPPKRSPKKANLADLEGPSETKTKNVSEEMDLHLPSKRSKLKKCATEELLEENVDPNMNRNNSSVATNHTSPKGRRAQKRSDTLSSADSSGPSPRKRICTKSSIVSDSVFESSPNPPKGKSQQDKKRTKSVASRAWKSQGLEGKGQRRHTTGDQQSIVRYLSGASDIDMREDRDEDAVSDTTEVFSQEEEDRKMAERLQKQFNLEQKFHIAAERFKGGAEQYHFRRKPRYYE